MPVAGTGDLVQGTLRHRSSASALNAGEETPFGVNWGLRLPGSDGRWIVVYAIYSIFAFFNCSDVRLYSGNQPEMYNLALRPLSSKFHQNA